MKEIKISGKTRVCGIFGCPIGHSFSPAMHNAAFKYLDMDWVYVPFQVEPHYLSQAVAGIRSLDLAGVNITVPHKQGVVDLIEKLTPIARLTGAVNTIVNAGGVLTGHNTDGLGFIKALKEEFGVQIQNAAALIIGAGGAARAVSMALAVEGATQIFISNRSYERALNLAEYININTHCKASVINWPQAQENRQEQRKWEDILIRASLVVQTTSMGMCPNAEESPPFPFHLLGPEHTVVDLVYNPPYTKFMKQSSGAGAKVCNGIGMLLHQGAIAFKLWTGAEPPIEVMRKALELEIMAKA